MCKGLHCYGDKRRQRLTIIKIRIISVLEVFSLACFGVMMPTLAMPLHDRRMKKGL